MGTKSTKPKEEAVEETTEETVAEEAVATETEAKPANKKKSVEEIALEQGSVSVTWKGNSRTYTKAVHGDKFLALAQEFATKFEGELVA